LSNCLLCSPTPTTREISGAESFGEDTRWQGVGYDVGRNPSGRIDAPEDAEFGGGRELGSRVERGHRHSTSDLSRTPLQVCCKSDQNERSVRQRVCDRAAFVRHAPRSLSSATSHCCRSDGTTRPSRARLYQASSALTCQRDGVD
jgi:hypothetical protein